MDAEFLIRWELPVSLGDTSSTGLPFWLYIFSATGRVSIGFLVVLTALGFGPLVATVADSGAEESDGVGKMFFVPDDTEGAVNVRPFAGVGPDVFDGVREGVVARPVLISDVMVMSIVVSTDDLGAVGDPVDASLDVVGVGHGEGGDGWLVIDEISSVLENIDELDCLDGLDVVGEPVDVELDVVGFVLGEGGDGAEVASFTHCFSFFNTKVRNRLDSGV